MTRSTYALVPDDVRALAASFDAPAGARSFAVSDPATEVVVANIANGDRIDASTAVDAADAAFPSWAATAPRRRSEILYRAFELMLVDADRLAGLISLENGKSLADASAEVAYAAEFFRWFAEEAVRTDGTFGESPSGGTRTIVTSRPVGVAALVSPWNFPAAMASRKLGPALAAGCTAVLKPAEETPLTALAIADVLLRAGLPEGVVTVVATTAPAEVVGTWMSDSRVRKISFTGSTGIGRLLLSQASERVVNSSMELGGNAPLVIARDADLAKAVTGAMEAKFRNGGQACTAANRLLVHADVADEFTARFGAAVESLHVGHAFSQGVEIGPLVSERAVAGVQDWIDRALSAGARISHRAPAPETGSFLAPTVLVDLPSSAEVLQEEIFGPVAPIVTWRDQQELLNVVNATELGLAAYVFSGDLAWALQLAEKIDAGMVGVNRGTVSDPSAPFGGIKQSGVGREGSREGMRAFTETQYFSVDWNG